VVSYQPTEIARIVGGDLHGGSQGVVTGVSIDSRTTVAGDLFVAISTPDNDGHRFVPMAFAKGAKVALVSLAQARSHLRDWDLFTLIAVEDPVEALQAWSLHHRRRFDIPVIAITGSNGKTTTKEFAAAALSSLGSVLLTEGNLNNHLGVPITLLRMSAEHRVAVIELGMNHAGEINLLGTLSEPDVGVITNTGQAHLEFFPSVESLVDAKWELAQTVRGDRLMVLNRDDAGLSDRGDSYDGPIRWYGVENDCEWHPVESTQDADGCWSFTIHGTRVQLRVPGHHMIGNALAALAVADAFGVPLDKAAAAIGKTESEARRMRSLKVGDVLVLDDAYNANPNSMDAAIKTLCSLDGRHIAILGGMHELGDRSVELHRELGRNAAAAGVIAVTVGSYGQHIAEGAREVDSSLVVEVASHEEATEWVLSNVAPGDALLIKGSRGEHMEIVVEALHEHLKREQS
jgi:UDP-N-acetylmuramoyl-tripeptide--D-alanyl-D-alanine ligase